MEVEELVLIKEISKKSGSVTSLALDKKQKFKSSKTLNFTNNDTGISVECGTGKVTDSKLRYWIFHLVLLVKQYSGKMQNNSRPHSFWAYSRSLEFKIAIFSFLLFTDEEIQQKFCKHCVEPKLYHDHPISYHSMLSIPF